MIAAALATASLLLLTPSPAQAQGGVPLWTNVYYGPRGGDVPVDIAVDSIGDVFVTGNSAGDGTFIDYLTIKYSADGVPLWANRFDRRVDYVRAIAVDSNGDVIVTGNTPDPANNNYEDYTTVRYSSVGDLLWVNFFDGGSRDFASSVAVDGGGNVLVSGESFNPNGTTDTVTIKYSSAGDTLWINRYGPHFYPSPTRIAVDGSGNVFVASRRRPSPSAKSDYVTVKYSNDGVPLWTNFFNGPADDYGQPQAIALDSSGNAFVTGTSDNVGGAPGKATIKYSGAGVPLWTNRSEGEAHGLALDSSGNVFVVGANTIKYTGAGVPVWTNLFSGQIAVDVSDNVFVMGSLSSDTAIITYSNAGLPLWTNRIECCASKMLVDRAGNVFVLGTAYDVTTSGYKTVKYSPLILPPRLDFQRLNDQLVLSWTNAGFSLQTAPAVIGPFTNLPAATSPYTNPLTAPQQFFRLKSN
ncbi:MAG TPA: SBBP repeat-containing protein [Verrucomicrobiae bacterium]|nr:SBBP repeat-containing protein [Verrucomicrobiae bacterium]